MTVPNDLVVTLPVPGFAACHPLGNDGETLVPKVSSRNSEEPGKNQGGTREESRRNQGRI